LAKADLLTPSNIVKLVLLNIVHWVSFLSIRDKNIWIFGSWDGKVFLDNPKYLFLASQKLSPAVKPIWISNNTALVHSLRRKGFKAYYTFQIQAVLYGLRAKYYFIDHAPLYGGFFAPTNLGLSGGAKIIQLWHGVPLKRLDSVGLVGNKHQSRIGSLLAVLAKANLFNLFTNYYFVASSRLFGRLMAESFALSGKKILLSGYPRNVFQEAHMLSIYSLQKGLNEKIRNLKAEGKRLLFYIPTFRDYGGDPITHKAIDLAVFEKFLMDNQCVLIVKFHEADVIKLGNVSKKNIIFLPNGFDIYEILSLCDVLITDYSSIFFDFLPFNRPIVFYPYDLKTYQTSARCFYFDYNEFVPGLITHDFNEMLKSVSSILQTGVDAYEEKREKLYDFCFEYKTLMLKNILVDY
jgi:CDP-glycerol glycerophosphotransferase (TagB/SpsB family)